MRNAKNSQQPSGMVAIMVTAVIMVVVSLLTIGFSRIVQRDQRQGLDNQLSTQAFYAAESGINEVISRIRAGLPVPEKTDCDVSGYGNGEIDPATPEVKFTCLMIDPNPATLVYNNGVIRAERSKVVKINPSQKPADLTFSWNDLNPSKRDVDNACDPSELPTVQNWGNRIGMLQVDIMPVPSGASTVQFERETLNTETATFLFYPCGIGNGSSSAFNYDNYSANDGSDDRGQIARVECDSGTGRCAARVDIPASLRSSTDSFYVKLKSIYSSVDVTINGRAPSTQEITFADAQVIIDSTGRANDVLRRIQVRYGIGPEYKLPEAAIQAQNGVCKLLNVSVSVDDSQCNYNP